MAEKPEDEDKTHEPTQKRLDDARRKGEVPRSADLSTAVAYGGILVAAATAGGWSVQRMGEAGTVLLGQADRLAPLMARAEGTAPMGGLLWRVAEAAAPLLGLPAVLVILGLIAQRALVFAPTKLEPKLSRISPVDNAKQKFGRSGLFEFAKSFVKLVVISAILAWYLRLRLEEIVASLTLSPGLVAAMLGRLSLEFLGIVTLLALGIGAIDMVFQVADHRRRQRMSHKELKDETKESEGDPHLKQRRRSRAQEIAHNQMLSDVPEASVVVVNPEHYAVALSWDPARPGAPVCVAKGVDEIAARIREIAAEAGVPIHRDPPTARALHATVDVGEEIRPEHYRPVAAAIRFADEMRRKARARHV
jgi:flagellar biosynthetic protein FlhB